MLTVRSLIVLAVLAPALAFASPAAVLVEDPVGDQGSPLSPRIAGVALTRCADPASDLVRFTLATSEDVLNATFTVVDAGSLSVRCDGAILPRSDRSFSIRLHPEPPACEEIALQCPASTEESVGVMHSDLHGACVEITFYDGASGESCGPAISSVDGDEVTFVLPMHGRILADDGSERAFDLRGDPVIISGGATSSVQVGARLGMVSDGFQPARATL